MGMGVAVLMIFCLFIGFCWLISGWIIRNKSKKHYWLKRGIVFLIPALSPVYIQVVEYILFQQACKEAVVYFPEEKHFLPTGIITNSVLNDDPINDFDGKFEYLIFPNTSSNDYVDLSQTAIQFELYINKSVNETTKGRKVTQEELLDVRYGYFRELKEYRNSSRINYYIFDFIKKKKIAGYSVVHSIFAGGGGIMKMPSCKFNSGQYERKDLNQRTLISKTFKMEYEQ